jgi:hypothetical protein
MSNKFQKPWQSIFSQKKFIDFVPPCFNRDGCSNITCMAIMRRIILFSLLSVAGILLFGIYFIVERMLSPTHQWVEYQ